MERDEVILIDTHVLIWAISDDRRLGPGARERLDLEAETGVLNVSAITPWEIALLAHKGRIVLGREPLAWIEAALGLPAIALAPIEPAIAVGCVTLPGELHGDPADRLIVATARYHVWPLMTADSALLGYGAEGYLQVIDARR